MEQAEAGGSYRASDRPVFDSLARGDLAGVTATSPIPLTTYLTGSDRRGLWQRRSRQVAADPGSAAWVTGIIWDQQHLLAVGTVGYHGPPDTSGMVEIGYAVDPAHRRRGYARAALEPLPARAAQTPQVHTVRVTIGPGNTASYRLASQYGFVKVGEQWDDEDGLEIIYEIPADRL
ncbi:GNAT family N-acetyltransferase [Amycolatopsis sp. WAC 01375]|nr:GNAT family N-acetyltransferase [Amycolatopsis sp. WAC 01375]